MSEYGRKKPSNTRMQIILIILIINCLNIAGCTNTSQSGISDHGIQTTSSTPVVTNLQTPSPPQPLSQKEKIVSTWIDKSVYNVGDTVRVEGKITGSSNPISYTIFTYDAVIADDFSKSVKNGSVTPALDGSFQIYFPINPKEIPVGFYVIFMHLPTGEQTKLQFLVDSKGVDCERKCSQPDVKGMQYNENGEAICYC